MRSPSINVTRRDWPAHKSADADGFVYRVDSATNTLVLKAGDVVSEKRIADLIALGIDVSIARER